MFLTFVNAVGSHMVGSSDRSDSVVPTFSIVVDPSNSHTCIMLELIGI